MKGLFISLPFLLLCNTFVVQAQSSNGKKIESTAKHNAWLKQQFSQQHQKLIPIVAVADMLYSCNIARQVEPVTYKLENLIVTMDKNRLAQKLIECLGDDDIKSDVALNFGLEGCFYEQLSHLPIAERQQKMALVKKAILSLSHRERQKSLTQCVTEQAIHYLQ